MLELEINHLVKYYHYLSVKYYDLREYCLYVDLTVNVDCCNLQLIRVY